MRPAYLIAEAGVNHGGHLRVALEMVDEAARAGVDAFKVQVYDPEKLATKAAAAYWDTGKEPTANQRELFQAHAGLTRDDYRTIQKACKDKGLDFIASVFHVEDVGWLAPIVDRIKIASGDITNRPLLRRMAAERVPVILSTGASTKDEIRDAVFTFPYYQGITLLHCTLAYPSRPEDANLSAIRDLRNSFDAAIGLSDHVENPVESIEVMYAAYLLGATHFEKHFTFDRTLRGNDHYHAFDAAWFVALRAKLEFAKQIVGSGGKRVLDCELAARDGARRSLAAKVDIPAGTKLTQDNTVLKRPGGGIVYPAGYAWVDIPADTTITEDMVAT